MTEQENNSLWSLNRHSKIEVNILDQEMSTDVAIIGGGFTGSSAALRLAENGVDVTVIEAEYSGFGGSGRNVGLTNAGLWINPNDVEKTIGSKYGERLNALLSDAPSLVHKIIDENNIQCEALRNGTLHLAHSDKGLDDLKKKKDQLDACGVDIELLDKDEAFTLSAAENYLGAILDKRAGTIQPLEYCHGLMLAAKLAGAKIYNGTPAQDIFNVSGKWYIKTEKGLLKADKVLIATNAYLSNIMPELKPTFTPMYYCQMATDPLNAEQLAHFLPGKNGTWDTRTVMRSYRTDEAGRLIIGTIGNIFMDKAPLLTSWANKMVRDTFPKIGSVKWTYKWAGRIACSKNYVPNFHHLGTGLYSINGFSGRGISPGTALGREMADFIMGTKKAEDLPLPLKTPENVPFNLLREAFYETGSQLTRIKDHFI
ncbi:MAG: FAD-binding oxidoreductase [Emcibacteraceae bacterium]|nr:FAD-binding oxidoreductase [Emcibacteraceae bacterium]MDG1997052.1 FAD-binding oxidoreductase [Emcibacteraceae bacterium]